MATTIQPVILSGGAGARLWPLSTPERPKQLLALTGDRTMLQETALRTAGAGFAPPLVVCGAGHADAIAAQLMEIGIAATLIVEPCPRNTAPAIALAALTAVDTAPDALLLVMPSDHVVAHPERLLAAVERARAAAEDGWLVTFGITPDAPATGYGWIETGAVIADGVHAAARFVEKPALADAQAMLASGGFLWNAGLFLFGARGYLDALTSHAPAVAAAARAAFAGAQAAASRLLPEATAFAAAPSISIDYAVMERAARVAVVPTDLGWSDIGSWAALHALGPADADGNVVAGPAVVVDSRDCLVRSDGPPVATLGVAGLIIVVANGHVLVADAARAEEVRSLAARLPPRAD